MTVPRKKRGSKTRKKKLSSKLSNSKHSGTEEGTATSESEGCVGGDGDGEEERAGEVREDWLIADVKKKNEPRHHKKKSEKVPKSVHTRALEVELGGDGCYRREEEEVEEDCLVNCPPPRAAPRGVSERQRRNKETKKRVSISSEVTVMGGRQRWGGSGEGRWGRERGVVVMGSGVLLS